MILSWPSVSPVFSEEFDNLDPTAPRYDTSVLQNVSAEKLTANPANWRLGGWFVEYSLGQPMPRRSTVYGSFQCSDHGGSVRV